MSFASVAETDLLERAFWPRDRFYDRAGRAISIAHWAKLRGDCEYRTIGDWCDGNGSMVRTVWTGFGFNYGHSESLIFETHSIVGDEALFYTYCTEADARRGHHEAVWRISTRSGHGHEFATGGDHWSGAISTLLRPWGEFDNTGPVGPTAPRPELLHDQSVERRRRRPR